MILLIVSAGRVGALSRHERDGKRAERGFARKSQVTHCSVGNPSHISAFPFQQTPRGFDEHDHDSRGRKILVHCARFADARRSVLLFVSGKPPFVYSRNLSISFVQHFKRMTLDRSTTIPSRSTRMLRAFSRTQSSSPRARPSSFSERC